MNDLTGLMGMQSVFELSAICVILLGFKKDRQIIRWEKKQAAKVLIWLHRKLNKNKRIKAWAESEKTNTAALIQKTEAMTTEGAGGHLVSNFTKYKTELLIMDTNNIKTAKKVWRLNDTGISYSSTGYNGIYSDVQSMFEQALNSQK